MSRAAPLALSMGDPSGIGGEIALKAYASGRAPLFFAIDDPHRLAAIAIAPVAEIDAPEDAAEVWPSALPVLPERLPAPPVPGLPDPRNAAPTIHAIERAVALTLEGRAAGVVTNPITKKALYDGAGFPHPGHTEFLAHLAGVPRTVMMLAGPSLRVAPITIHIPLADVPAALTAEAVVDTARILDAGLRRWFGLEVPRLALAGLNPHAGEGGAIGREEIEVLIPAVERLAAEGIAITGPLPADTMFHAAARANYDCALTCYHDQGLIPMKALDFDRGVNVTLGLPFPRTSPDHGTAYDIAGRGVADPSSLIEALIMAAEMSGIGQSAPIPA